MEIQYVANELLTPGEAREKAAQLQIRMDAITAHVHYAKREYYTSRKIYVNLGRQLVYPYRMGTNLGRARTVGRRWCRPVYTIELRDGFEVVLFVFLHELYHLLVKHARRNTRQKEGMCDRFAARYLVDRYGASVRDPKERPVSREEWDFQDLDGFVAAARDRRVRRQSAFGSGDAARGSTVEQLLMFPA